MRSSLAFAESIALDPVTITLLFVVLWLIEVERVGRRRGWLHIRLPGVSGCTVTYSM
jgi:uncharacterized membrane protein